MGMLLWEGCSVYSFKGQGIGGIKSISVEQFDDKTGEFGIRETVQADLVSRLLNDRTLTVVPSANADAILTGTIVAIDDRPMIQSVSIAEGRVALEATIHSFEDPMCCPKL